MSTIVRGSALGGPFDGSEFDVDAEVEEIWFRMADRSLHRYVVSADSKTSDESKASVFRYASRS